MTNDHTRVSTGGNAKQYSRERQKGDIEEDRGKKAAKKDLLTHLLVVETPWLLDEGAVVEWGSR